MKRLKRSMIRCAARKGADRIGEKRCSQKIGHRGKHTYPRNRFAAWPRLEVAQR